MYLCACVWLYGTCLGRLSGFVAGCEYIVTGWLAWVFVKCVNHRS